MKIFERAIVTQLMIKDDYQEDRAKKFLQNLQEIMKMNVSNYKEMDTLIDILFKIVQRNAIAVEIINKQQAIYTFIERWQKENPHFPLNQNKQRIFK